MRIDSERLNELDFASAITPKTSGWKNAVRITKMVIEEAASSSDDYRSKLVDRVALHLKGLRQLETALTVIDVARQNGVFSSDFDAITMEDLLLSGLSKPGLKKRVLTEYMLENAYSEDETLIGLQMAAAQIGCDRLAIALREKAPEIEKVPILTLFSQALYYEMNEAAKRIIEGYSETIQLEIECQDVLELGWRHYVLPISAAIISGETDYIDTLVSWGYDVAWEKPRDDEIAMSWPLFNAAIKGNIEMIDKLFSMGVSSLQEDVEGGIRDVITDYLVWSKEYGKNTNRNVLERLYARDEQQSKKNIFRYFSLSISPYTKEAFSFVKEKGVSFGLFFANEKNDSQRLLRKIITHFNEMHPLFSEEDFCVLFAQVLRCMSTPLCHYVSLLDKILEKRLVHQKDGVNHSQLVWEGMENASAEVKRVTSLKGCTQRILENTDHILKSFGSFTNLSSLLNHFPYIAGKKLQASECTIFIPQCHKKLEYLAGCFGVYDVGSVLDEVVKLWGFETLSFLTFAPIDEKKLWPMLTKNINKKPLSLETLNRFLGRAEISNEGRRVAFAQNLSRIVNAIKNREAVLGMPSRENDREGHEQWCVDFERDLGIILAVAEGDRENELSLVNEFGLAGGYCATRWRECVDHFYSIWVEKNRDIDIPSRIYAAIAEQARDVVLEVAHLLQHHVNDGNGVHLVNRIGSIVQKNFGIRPLRHLYHDPSFVFNERHAMPLLKQRLMKDALVKALQSLDEKLRGSEVTLSDWLLERTPKTFTTTEHEEILKRFASFIGGKNVYDALLCKGVSMLRNEASDDAVARTLFARMLHNNATHSLWDTLSVETGYCYREGFSARLAETFEEALARKEAELNQDRSKRRRLESAEIRKFKEKYVADVVKGRAKLSAEAQKRARKLLSLPRIRAIFGPIFALPNIEKDLEACGLLREKPSDTLEDVFVNARKDAYRELITDDTGALNTKGIWGAIVAEGLIKFVGVGLVKFSACDPLELPPFAFSNDKEERFCELLRMAPEKSPDELMSAILSSKK